VAVIGAGKGAVSITFSYREDGKAACVYQGTVVGAK
jgi:hypothetical protein